MSNTKYLKIKRPHLQDLEWLEKQLLSLPTTKITSNVVETAERIRVLPKTSPFPGKYKFAKSSYMYEIAMVLSPQDVTEIVNICKAGQMGATAGSTENLILFKIAEDPGPVLCMVPTNEFLKKWDETRLGPMIDSSGLKLKSSYKKNSQHGGNGDAIGRKSWVGGKLDIITFAQLNQLRNQSYQIICIEDAEELVLTAQKGGGQGNVKKVAFIRSMTFSGRRKILDISTPIYKDNSHIWTEFLKGDQRYYYIECPDCGHSQRLIWKHLKYNKDEHGHVIEDSVYYECQDKNCNYHIKEEQKPDFLLCEELGGTAKWIPHNVDKAEPLTKSYQFSAMYAGPGFDTWYQLAKEFVSALNDSEEMQAFVNLRLGEPFSDYSEAPPAETCHILKGTYKKGQLPSQKEGTPLFTMLGADVQAGNKRDGKWVKGKESRIEASLWGYGLNDREWLIDHYIIYGDVTDYRSGAFAKFKKMIKKDVFPIAPTMTFIDSRHQTDQVKKFCNRGLNIFPVMGIGKTRKGVFNKIDLSGYQSGNGGPLPLYELNNNSLKRDLYNTLGLRQDPMTEEYPAGYMMFPHDLEAKYFEQLTTERPISVIKHGKHDHYEWDAGGRSNETFDCALYAKQAKNVFMYERSIANEEETTNEREFWKWAYNYFGIPKVTMIELAEKHARLWEILLS
jgi:phage terminase large subunit GpA-like protein